MTKLHQRVQAVLLLLVACSDTGVDSLGSSGASQASSSGSTPDGSSSGGSSSGGSSSGGSSSGGSSSGGSSSGSLMDAGTDAPTSPGDAGIGPFQGAPAFVNQVGRDARDTAHNFAGNTPAQNPAKQHCLDCHLQANFGGTVFKDPGGTMPLANAEVVVQAQTGGPKVIVHTDQDGNFIVFGNAPVKARFPALTAARTATKTHTMVGAIANGNCNKCHNGTTTAFIYVN